MFNCLRSRVQIRLKRPPDLKFLFSSREIKPSFTYTQCQKFHTSKSFLVTDYQRHQPIVLHKKFLSSNKSSPDVKGDNSSSRISTIASVGLGLSVLLGKTKYVLVALKLTKAAPLLSMIATSLTYSLFFGWQYAVGMVGMLFFHECGHAIVMQRYGIPFSHMVFIPFMGAVTVRKDLSRNAFEEAMIAFGGPVAGTIAAFAVGTIGIMNGSQLLIALADFGYMINLFNLLPIGSMDGGRIGGAVSPWFNVVGFALGCGLIYNGVIHNPIFYLIMIAAGYSSISRLLGWDLEDGRSKNYYNIPRSSQFTILIGYILLIAFLLKAMSYNNLYRKHPKQLQAEKYRDSNQLFQNENDENFNFF